MKKNIAKTPKHFLYTTQEMYALFAVGSKTIALYPDHDIYDKFKAGDNLRVRYTTALPGIPMKIVGIRRYTSLEDVVIKENIAKIKPDFANLSKEEILERLPDILGYKNKNNDRVIALELKKIKTLINKTRE